VSIGSEEGRDTKQIVGERRFSEGVCGHVGSVRQLEMPSGGGSEDGTVRNFETSRRKGRRFTQVRDGGQKAPSNYDRTKGRPRGGGRQNVLAEPRGSGARSSRRPAATAPCCRVPPSRQKKT
jgi:hypothetical protein